MKENKGSYLLGIIIGIIFEIFGVILCGIFAKRKTFVGSIIGLVILLVIVLTIVLLGSTSLFETTKIVG